MPRGKFLFFSSLPAVVLERTIRCEVTTCRGTTTNEQCAAILLDKNIVEQIPLSGVIVRPHKFTNCESISSDFICVYDSWTFLGISKMNNHVQRCSCDTFQITQTDICIISVNCTINLWKSNSVVCVFPVPLRMFNNYEITQMQIHTFGVLTQTSK